MHRNIKPLVYSHVLYFVVELVVIVGVLAYR
jgi:hypothetical protein